jgi:predicted nuclease of predicted toxin-antitoxin system
MRLKVDENVHPAAAEHLIAGGHDAATVWDENLRGSDDETIARVCREEGRTLLTLDLGFANIRRYQPRDYPGLIVLRLHSQAKRSVLAAVARLEPMLRGKGPHGRLWIVTETDVRIRGGE